MIKIERALPGEHDGTMSPEVYGFDVIREEPLSKEEEDERVRRLYIKAKKLSGTVIPKLEPYLEEGSPEEASGAPKPAAGDEDETAR